MPSTPEFARDESKVKHLLHGHLKVLPPYVQATITAPVAPPNKIDMFFRELRTGHKRALNTHLGSEVAGHIGQQEHGDFTDLGDWAKCAGRMAITESGLYVLEESLHHATLPPQLDTDLNRSIMTARSVLA